MEQAVEDPLIDRPDREPGRSRVRQAKTLRPVAHGAFRFRAELTHFLVFAPRGSVTLFAHDDTGEFQVAVFLPDVEVAFAGGHFQVASNHVVADDFFTVEPFVGAAVTDPDETARMLHMFMSV